MAVKKSKKVEHEVSIDDEVLEPVEKEEEGTQYDMGQLVEYFVTVLNQVLDERESLKEPVELPTCESVDENALAEYISKNVVDAVKGIEQEQIDENEFGDYLARLIVSRLGKESEQKYSELKEALAKALNANYESFVSLIANSSFNDSDVDNIVEEVSKVITKDNGIQTEVLLSEIKKLNKEDNTSDVVAGVTKAIKASESTIKDDVHGRKTEVLETVRKQSVDVKEHTDSKMSVVYGLLGANLFLTAVILVMSLIG